MTTTDRPLLELADELDRRAAHWKDKESPHVFANQAAILRAADAVIAFQVRKSKMAPNNMECLTCGGWWPIGNKSRHDKLPDGVCPIAIYEAACKRGGWKT